MQSEALEQGLVISGLRWLLRLLARLFFRTVEVTGSETVPREGGGLLVAWHPNGLADGVLILGFSPRPVVVGARHGLFRLPVVGTLLRAAGAVPLFRRRDRGDLGAPSDESARREANQRSLGALAEACRGSLVAVFPEGATHDEPGLLELRAGAARLFERAQQAGGDPVLLPVGLHYERKHAFRSRALLVFHPPVELPPDLRPGRRPDDSAAPGGSFVERLTAMIQQQLIEVTHPTESWHLHRAMERLRSLVRAEAAARQGGPAPGRAPMQERDAGFARVWSGYHRQRERDPAVAERLVTRVTRYGEALRLLGMNDRDLDDVRLGRTAWRGLLLAGEVLLMLLLLPTVVLVGGLVTVPAALVVWIGARALSLTRKEQAGLKMLLGLVILPCTWVGASLLVGLAWTQPLPGFDWRPEALWVRVAGMLVLCVISALLGLRHHRLLAELRHGLRALWAGGFRRSTVERLRRQRAALHDDAMALVAALDV